MAVKLLSYITILLGLCQMFREAATQHCSGKEESISGMMLQGHIYKKITGAPLGDVCLRECYRDDRCQSFNYVIWQDVCELNNRTKEARPEDFVPNADRYYFKRDCGRVPLGSIPELPAETCKEIKASEGRQAVSGKYWFDSIIPGKTVLAHCDMKTEAILNLRTNGRKGRFGIIQTFTIPRTGRYLIKAWGARGGTHSYNYSDNAGTYYGGKGASKEGTFGLTQGAVLNIVVGQRGGDSVEVKGGQSTSKTAAELGLSVEDNAGTGGGGGSFVYTTNNVLLLAAGGGGGASGGYNGVDGQAGTNGTSSVGKSYSRVRKGGTGGQPGECNTESANYHGGVGAGWFAQGCDRKGPQHGERGGSHAQGWIGGQAGAMNSGNNGGPAPGAVGGFGGGGGGSEDNGASGGGGGYSGGGSGIKLKQAGGGGGSYCSGDDCSGLSGINLKDDGLVLIMELLD